MWVTPEVAALRLTDAVVPDRPSRLWQASKLFLLLSLVPLVIAIGLVTLGVHNPGVQDCGSPAVFVITDRANERVALVGVEITSEQRVLDAQPRCAARVGDRLRLAGYVGVGFLVLAATGAALGLVDDRVRLRHEPPFEEYLDDSDP